MDYGDVDKLTGIADAMQDFSDLKRIAESLVRKRSNREVRRYPRFPTVEAIEDRAGEHGFDGFIVYAQDPSDIQFDSESTGTGIYTIPSGHFPRSNVEVVRNGVNVMDFSEGGIQISYEFIDPSIKTCHPLYFQVQDAQIPIRLCWNREIGNTTRSGFHFLRRADKCPELAGFISDLGMNLLDKLVMTFCDVGHKTQEEYPFIFVSILYNLRLQFIRVLSELNKSIAGCEACGLMDTEIKNIIVHRKRIYDIYMQARQARIATGSEEFRKKFITFLKPFEQYEGSVILKCPGHVLLKREILLSLMNCIMWKSYNRFSVYIHPSVRTLYGWFRLLFEVFPDEAIENEMGVQFKIYNDMICHVAALNEQTIHLLTRSGEAATRSDPG